MSDYLRGKILSDARLKLSEYADRLEVFESGLPGLPQDMLHFAINIKGLHGYLPISYIVYENNLYTSLRPGDFAALMKRVDLFNSDRWSALDFAICYFLLDFPSRERRIIENVEDLDLGEESSYILIQKVKNIVTSANMQKEANKINISFYCYNNRTGFIEQFKITVYPTYHYDAENFDRIQVLGT